MQCLPTHFSFSFPSGQAAGEERRSPQHIGADHERRLAAGLHRRSRCGGVVGADGLQRLALPPTPQEEAAGTLHHVLRVHTSRCVGESVDLYLLN